MFSFQAGGETWRNQVTIYGTHIEVVQTRGDSNTSSRYLVNAEAALPIEHRLQVKPEAALPTSYRFRELTREVQERPASQIAKDKKAVARVEALVSRCSFPHQLREDAWLVKPSSKVQAKEPWPIQKNPIDQVVQAESHRPIVVNREKKVIPIVAPAPQRQARPFSKTSHKSAGPDHSTQIKKPGKKAIPIVAPTAKFEAQSPNSSNKSLDQNLPVQPKQAGTKAIAIVRPTPEWEAQEAERKTKAKDPRQTVTVTSSPSSSRASKPTRGSAPALTTQAKSRTKSAPAELASPSHSAPPPPQSSIATSSPRSTATAKSDDESTSSQETMSQTTTALFHPLPKPVYHPSLWPGR
ncbi:hypothetical protein LTR64_004963 [Lithohypha guttulata]|uniref:uncharacterized protein n=1 Tax=Lithohypha guttulata TaxID=1690604 RepID=UPI002DE006E5|nr:hypothetical protein LTR51_005200 [Lithohypha guttulata]